MIQVVQDTLRRFYQQHDHETYLRRCRQALDVAELVVDIVQGYSTESIDVLDYGIWPAWEVRTRFPTYRRGAFAARFDTTIKISKIAKLFHVLHGFDVENRHVTRVAPTLDGYGDIGYISCQFQLHEKVRDALVERGYAELDLADMEEIIPELSFPESVTIFGRQVSVEYALFHDVVLGLCVNDSAKPHSPRP